MIPDIPHQYSYIALGMSLLWRLLGYRGEAAHSYESGMHQLASNHLITQSVAGASSFPFNPHRNSLGKFFSAVGIAPTILNFVRPNTFKFQCLPNISVPIPDKSIHLPNRKLERIKARNQN
jgi:hypothetical protein